MTTTVRATEAPGTGPTDEEVARRVVAGETALFELLMRRHNTRVYRAVRGLLRDEAEVEDVMQQAYVAAWRHLGDFDARARFSTWMIRIAVNEALQRLRKDRKLVLVADSGTDAEESAMIQPHTTPEEDAANHELGGLIERALDRLPALYRSVFVLREIEGLSTEDTAQALSVSTEVVKTRLHRARAALQASLETSVQGQLRALYRFEAPRCDRVVAAVLARLR